LYGRCAIDADSAGIGDPFKTMRHLEPSLRQDIVIIYWTARACLLQRITLAPLLQFEIRSKYVELDVGSLRGVSKYFSKETLLQGKDL
jgi:hypothetical protein